MTRKEIVRAFELDIDTTASGELAALSELASDPMFATEAGEEFVTAVAVVGLHRIVD
jgi:hypothetical protein